MCLSRALALIVLLLAPGASNSDAEVATPGPTPLVGRLAFDLPTRTHKGIVNWSLRGTIIEEEDTCSWTFSGAGVTPTTPVNSCDAQSVSSQPGVVTAVLKIKNPAGQVVNTYNSSAPVIGGPFTITSNRTGQKRELQTGTGFETWRNQPWVLDYFDYTYQNVASVPEGVQEANFLMATRLFATQPAGTTMTWELAGDEGADLAFCEGASATSAIAKVSASGQTARAGAQINLKYSYTVGAQTFVYLDSSNEYHTSATYWTNVAQIDPMYKAITAHRPTTIVDTTDSKYQDSYLGPPTWGYLHRYYMELLSNVGDPIDMVDVQERFAQVPTHFNNGQPLPGPFGWNGYPETEHVWYSGEDGLNTRTGYSNHGRFMDHVGFDGWASATALPIPSPVAPPFVLSFSHRYWGATGIFTNGGPGVQLQLYQARLFTNGATHAP